ncbi:E2F-associated phosphoprotein [Mytilus edulis]|uniref:E2F-associated phosphoprotein n=1 Tax=Mytilus edulis TaxID=6550 RepID=A0A8S3TN36_MYTED|nr:E2F-associated phosphoprotein [Mytilus edulis]
MNRITDRDYDYYDFEDDSDHEPCDSSDDDIEVILHGTPEQKRKLQTKVQQRHDSSSEDDFEKEMNNELNKHIKGLVNERSSNVAETVQVSSKAQDQEKPTEQQQFYDDIYYEFRRREMVLQGDERVKRRQPVQSNDDLLYDPDLDEEDQRWVDAERQAYQLPVPSGSKSKRQNSDAVLNCPACMTLLCLDCQGHDVYENQYRAMFVKNCRVDTSELLKQPLQKKKRTKKQKTLDTTNNETEDNFHPVKCTECSTVVGVFDNDEVYHFFNVLASHT